MQRALWKKNMIEWWVAHSSFQLLFTVTLLSCVMYQSSWNFNVGYTIHYTTSHRLTNAEHHIISPTLTPEYTDIKSYYITQPYFLLLYFSTASLETRRKAFYEKWNWDKQRMGKSTCVLEALAEQIAFLQITWLDKEAVEELARTSIDRPGEPHENRNCS